MQDGFFVYMISVFFVLFIIYINSAHNKVLQIVRPGNLTWLEEHAFPLRTITVIMVTWLIAVCLAP